MSTRYAYAPYTGPRQVLIDKKTSLHLVAPIPMQKDLLRKAKPDDKKEKEERKRY